MVLRGSDRVVVWCIFLLFASASAARVAKLVVVHGFTEEFLLEMGIVEEFVNSKFQTLQLQIDSVFVNASSDSTGSELFDAGRSIRGRNETYAIIGPSNSDSVRLFHPHAVMMNVPHIAPIASDPIFEGMDRFPLLIRMTQTYDQQINALLDVIASQNWTSIAIISSESDYSHHAGERLRQSAHERGVKGLPAVAEMISHILISSSRLWLALFMLYVCAMVYGLFSLTGANVERKTVESFEPMKQEAPVYEDDLLRISSYNQEYGPNGSLDSLRDLPIDFPLARGLALPRPGLRAGGVRKNATVAVGIPSIKRDGHDYLIATVESLIKNLTPEQKLNTVFVIFLGELDFQFLDRRVLEIKERFQREMDDGTLEIISPSKNLYPDWSKSIRSTFGDTLERVKWRSKQNLDQVFLMMHIYHLRAKYYLMMEDDVMATREYMTKLLQTVKMKETQPQPWIYISFCSLGAIGKLFRRRTLPAYASFIHTFWNAKPLDWLQIDFARARVCSYDEAEKTCFKRLKAVLPETHPSLFQHVGKFSSLPGKIQKLRDTRFKN